MRAVRFQQGEFAVTEIADPPPLAPHQIRIDVVACGICGSDLSMSKDPCRFVEVAHDGGYPLATFDPDARSCVRRLDNRRYGLCIAIWHNAVWRRIWWINGRSRALWHGLSERRRPECDGHLPAGQQIIILGTHE